MFHVASSGCCWEALCVYVWAVGSLHSSGRGPEMEHDRNSQLRVKCPERKKKKKIAQEDHLFLSTESLKEEGVTGTGGRDCYQQLHFLSFKRRRWLNVHRLLQSVLVKWLRRDRKAKVTSCIWLYSSL